LECHRLDKIIKLYFILTRNQLKIKRRFKDYLVIKTEDINDSSSIKTGFRLRGNDKALIKNRALWLGAGFLIWFVLFFLRNYEIANQYGNYEKGDAIPPLHQCNRQADDQQGRRIAPAEVS
jgi:hypothetical protein